MQHIAGEHEEPPLSGVHSPSPMSRAAPRSLIQDDGRPACSPPCSGIPPAGEVQDAAENRVFQAVRIQTLQSSMTGEKVSSIKLLFMH